MSRRYSYSQIKARLGRFYPRPGCGCEFQAGYRAALDEVLLSFSPETFFASADTLPKGQDHLGLAGTESGAVPHGDAADAQPYEPDGSDAPIRDAQPPSVSPLSSEEKTS